MKILAIDIGTAHIKSVIIETKFKRFDIVLHDITSVPDAWEPISPNEQILSPGQLSTLAAIKQRYAEGINRIVTNLPLSLYSSRFQTFPMKDKRKVQAAIKFAIEDEIPFDVENCIVTSHIFPTKTKETHALTGFAPIASLERFIEGMTSMGLSPDCLMMDDAALALQFNRAKFEGNCALLTLGHRKSGMFFFRNGLPVMHRNSMVAGYAITSAIANRYSIGMAEAELAKVDRGFLATPEMRLNPDQLAFSETIRGAMEPIFSDFQQSLMAFSSRFGEQISTIYICGGTSLMPGLPEYLAHRWDKRVMPLEVKKLFPHFSIQPQKNVEWLLPQACALGLSQVPGDNRSQINFRSGKLHLTSKGLNLNFQQFVYPAKLAFSIYLVAMLSVIAQTFLLNRQKAETVARYDRVIQSVTGKVSQSFLAGLRSSPTKLKAAVEKKVKEYEDQVKGSQSATASAALQLLQDLSKAVPPSVVTEIKLMEYSPGRVSFTLESPSQTAAEKASSTLSQLPLFVNPKAGPIENGKGIRKKFSFNATLKKGT